ncbi:MAG: CehA/McbA family metallohydrolase [Nitrospirota bacterium]
MLIDMHVHTSFSPCSLMRIPQVIAKARESGIDGICITDHDTTASEYEMRKIASNESLCIIIGIEYTTFQGDFLVFGPTGNMPSDMDAETLLGWAKRSGGICIPAHPFRRSRPADISILKSCHVIESLNGRNRRSENDTCRNWLKEYGNGTMEIGGSDAHTPNEIGHVVTVFKKNIYSVDDLVRELASGSFSPMERFSG